MWSLSTPELGVPQMAIEAGSALSMASANAREWVEIVRAALRHMGMLPGTTGQLGLPVMTTSSHPASTGGAFVAAVAPGERVRRGQKLGEVRNLIGEVQQVVESQVSGVVAVLRTGVRVHPGQSLVTVASEA